MLIQDDLHRKEPKHKHISTKEIHELCERLYLAKH